MLWPNLQELAFVNSGDTTPEMLKKIFPHLQQFTNLQQLCVPPILCEASINGAGYERTPRGKLAKDVIAQLGPNMLTGVHVKYVSNHCRRRSCNYWPTERAAIKLYRSVWPRP